METLEYLMSLKITEISPRQQRVFRLLAEGLTPTQVAKEVGYTQSHVSRLQHSEAGRAELARLRVEIEAMLAVELPGMVNKAIGILKQQMDNPLPEYRCEAAKFVIRHLAKPFLEQIAYTPETDNAIIDIVQTDMDEPQQVFSTNRQGGYHDVTTNP
jgi:predicted transcriptional regulator